MASAAPSSRPVSSRTAWLVALGIPAVLLLLPLASSGIWDPYELNVADLARRIAVHPPFGASGLSLDGVDNSMPKLGDLGRNELGVTSIALGFRLFGLHEWAGRLPLALWALAGIAATCFGLSRLVDRRAGVYGALVLGTMPLYFIQARTMLGDVVTMAAVAIAFFGLAVATFGTPQADEDAARAQKVRAGALALGLAGLAAGFDSRGAVLGVAVPALGVGAAWAIARASGGRAADRFGDLAGAVALAVGAVAAVVGVQAVFKTAPNDYSVLVGASIAPPPKLPTFDFVILYLGHSLFPWSAFVPFAVGRLFREPTFAPTEDDGAGSAPDRAAEARESATRLVLLVGAAVAFGAHAVLAPKTGYLAFVGPAILAGIAAVAIRDFERGAPPSRALAVGVAMLAALYFRDYNMFPDKGLSAFAVSGATFPESFKAQAGHIVALSTAVFTLVVFLAWMERDPPEWMRREDYAAWPRAIAKAWDGNLLWGLVALEAGLVLVAAGIAIGMWVLHAKQVLTMGVQVRVAMLNAFWIAPIAFFLSVWGVMAVRDGFRKALAVTRRTRAEATVAAGLAVGALLSLWYYPALAAQLSPKDVFEAYGRMHGSGDALGLLGVNSRSANYYAGSEVKTLGDVNAAFSWLSGGAGRRWLVVRNEDLARLNSLWRARPGGARENLPVLDARSSQILLASNQLAGAEKNHNPLDAIVLDHEPLVGNRTGAVLEDKLENVGWDLWDQSGQNRVDAVVPGRKYRFRIYWKVLAPVSGEWETFIHIDGFQRRFNGDHKTTGGKYPFSLWQAGDVVIDDYEFSLEPNFTPGRYSVLYGLFVGDNRMKVKSGRHDDNRIDGGGIVVK